MASPSRPAARLLGQLKQRPPFHHNSSYFSSSSSSFFSSSLRWPASIPGRLTTGVAGSPSSGVGRNQLAWTLVGVAAACAGSYCYKMAIDEPVRLDPASLAERDALMVRESGVTEQSPMRLRMEEFIKEQQRLIVRGIEEVDGNKFRVDEWQRKEGGGGITCVLQDGKVFEKAGVGVSVVYGSLPKAAIQQMRVNHRNIAGGSDTIPDKLDFFAAGLSLVIHPSNPMAPTVHLNYRYFETAYPDGSSGAWWFGGGADLTPSYLFDEDAIHFHRTLKDVCDKHDKSYYSKFKKWCDEYFYNKHRGETRGVGGIFFDDLDETVSDRENTFAFIQDGLRAFLPSYVPIINRRKDMPFTPEEKEWQQLRRGKYVEFNLVHDRGTAFGLNSPGARVESILMSLPRTASWAYMHEPAPKSREARLTEVLRNPKEWV